MIALTEHNDNLIIQYWVDSPAGASGGNKLSGTYKTRNGMEPIGAHACLIVQMLQF